MKAFKLLNLFNSHIQRILEIDIEAFFKKLYNQY